LLRGRGVQEIKELQRTRSAESSLGLGLSVFRITWAEYSCLP